MGTEVNTNVNVFVRAFVKGFNREMASVQTTLGQTTKRVGIMNNLVGQTAFGMNKAQKNITRVGFAGRVVGGVFRGMARHFQRFRFELLGVMFFGMALQRIFTGLLQPALQVSGIFELISATLEIVFLPVALVLLEALLPILEWFMDLPEPVKLVIGVIAVLGAILGVAMFAFGTLGLGILSIAMLIATLLVGIVSLAGGVLTIGGGIVIVLAVFALLAIGIGVVIGIIALAIAAFFLFSSDAEGAMNSFFKIVDDIMKDVTLIFEGLIEFLQGVFALDAEAAFEGFKKIAEGVVGAVGTIFEDLVPLIVGVFDDVKTNMGKWFTELIFTFIPSFKAKFDKAIFDLIPKPLQDLIAVPTTIIGGIGAGFRNLISGVIPGFANGGLVTRPTLGIIGERGPELITPVGAGAAAGVGSTINITVNANSVAGLTAEEIASVVERRLGDEMRRLNI